MTQAFLPRIGGIVSADIAVPEHAKELRFYSRVLTTGESPLWQGDLMNSHGQPVIGLGERKDEYAHLPLQWMPHIQVADVAASVKRVLELKGTELMHGKDEDGNSQWAALRDPDGAAFGIIPVVPAGAVPKSPENGAPAGSIAWVDLTVPDASGARDFYREVVGWSAEDVPMNDGAEPYADFNMLGGDGAAAAGICHGRGTNQGVPPVWMIYLPVGDITESLRRVEEEGGKVIKRTQRADGSDWIAVIQDPAGAFLALAAN